MYSIYEFMEEKHPCSTLEEHKMTQPLWRGTLQYLTKLQTHLPFNQNDPISTMFTQKLHLNNMRSFLAILYEIEKSKSLNRRD